MKSYKQQLEKKLSKNNWEIVQIRTHDEWWIEEIWKIKPVRQSAELELFIVFKVDPLDDQNCLITSVDAFSKMPLDRLDKEFLVRSLNMQKGRFDEKMEIFFNEIITYSSKF